MANVLAIQVFVAEDFFFHHKKTKKGTALVEVSLGRKKTAECG